MTAEIEHSTDQNTVEKARTQKEKSSTNNASIMAQHNKEHNDTGAGEQNSTEHRAIRVILIPPNS